MSFSSRFLISFLFLFLLIPAQSHAQSKEEFEKKLAVEKTDTGKVKLLIELIYYSTDTTEKFDYASQAVALATKAGYKKGIADALATEAYERLMLSDFSAATVLYTEALKIRNEINDLRGLAECYHELGMLDLQFQNYRHAFYNFDKAMPLNVQTKNDAWLKNNYESVASVYSEMKKYDSSMFYLRKAEMLVLKQKLDASLLYHNMANLFLKMNKIDSCTLYIQKSDAAFDAAGNAYGHWWNKMLSADVLLAEGNANESIPLLEDVYAYANAEKDGELLLAVIPELLEAYHQTKNYEKGFPLQEKWGQLKDSLISLDKANLITGLQLKYETDEREKVNRLISEEKEEAGRAETNKQKLIRNIFISGFLVLGILAFVIFRSLQQNKRSKILIEKQKEMVEEKQKEILDSITYAKRLQQAILPPANLVKQYFPESFILYKPKDIVAGDFYWLENLNGQLFLAAADCTGHGVPGAMVSVVCHNALNRAVKEFHLADPGKILDKVRELILETFEKSDAEVMDGMDISLLCISTSPAENVRQITWAGANNPLWFISENTLTEIKADKQPVGKHEHAKPFTTHTVNIQKNGMIYLFTDGYADQFGGPKGKKFRYKQLEELLLSISGIPAEEQKEKLAAVFEDWKGPLEQIDDVCILGIRV